MNATITHTLIQPVILSPTPSKVRGEEVSLGEENSSDMTSLAPLAGAFLAHNTTQSLLLGKAVTYFANPVANHFLNLPIAATAGMIAYAVAKMGLSDFQKEKASTDLEAVTKSIGWSTFFSTCGAIGLHNTIIASSAVDPVNRVLTHAAGSLLGTTFVDAGFVLASVCLSAVLMDLAAEMFKEEPKKA